MAQPSPRPWRVEGVTILDANGNVVAVCRQAKPSNTMIALANAELIVAAVNDRPAPAEGASFTLDSFALSRAIHYSAGLPS